MSTALAWMTKPLAFKPAPLAWNIGAGGGGTEHDFADTDWGYYVAQGSISGWPTPTRERAAASTSQGAPEILLATLTWTSQRVLHEHGLKPAGITITQAVLSLNFTGSPVNNPLINVYLTNLTNRADVNTYKDFTTLVGAGYQANFPLTLDYTAFNSWPSGNNLNILMALDNDTTNTLPGASENTALMGHSTLKLWY